MVYVKRLKVLELEPAVTIAAHGTDIFGSVVLRTISAPPEGAGPERVTVQVLLTFEVSVVELHCREEISVTADRLRFTLCDVPLYDAVTDPFWFVLRFPVLIANDPAVAFAANLTNPGIVNPSRPALLTFTTAPPDPTAFDSVTVQIPLEFAPNVVVLH